MKSTKVFGIGFHKTGTKSLAAALRLLGYRVAGPNNVYNENVRHTALASALGRLERFDAFQDNPWPLLYRELDRHVPGSKFILTVRDTDRWISSVVAEFGSTSTAMREWIYGVGSPLGHEQVYRERYERHNREVLEYFADRPGDLLVLRLTEGDGWETLCRFLKEPVPARPFPHRNSADSRQDRLRLLAGRGVGMPG